jgi:hypothetical protein
MPAGPAIARLGGEISELAELVDPALAAFPVESEAELQRLESRVDQPPAPAVMLVDEAVEPGGAGREALVFEYGAYGSIAGAGS